MDFLIQQDHQISVEGRILHEKLRQQVIHTSKLLNTDSITSTDKTKLLNKIPVGDIRFMNKFIKHVYRIDKMNPIEVPKYLRKNKYLKRYYDFQLGKDIISGNMFIKDVDILKNFSMTGYVDKELLNPNTLYQVSDLVNIIAEYRIYVVDGKIINMSQYDGDWSIFPDTNLIKEMVSLINDNEKHLKSYTIDIAVNSNNQTLILEVHNFASIGFYSTIMDTSIIYGYRDGLNYLINDNRSIREELNIN